MALFIRVFCVYPVFPIHEKHIGKCKICVILKLALKVPIALGQIHIFKTMRTDSAYLQTRSHTSPGLLWNSIIYENMISQVQWLQPLDLGHGCWPKEIYNRGENSEGPCWESHNVLTKLLNSLAKLFLRIQTIPTGLLWGLQAGGGKTKEEKNKWSWPILRNDEEDMTHPTISCDRFEW